MARFSWLVVVPLSAVMLLSGGTVKAPEIMRTMSGIAGPTLTAVELTPVVPLTQTPVLPPSVSSTASSEPQPVATTPIPTITLLATTPVPGGEPAAGARVTTDKLSYHHGETILVTIRNNLSDVIYAPPRGPCSVVGVQRLEARQWVTEGSCPAQEVHFFIIAPESELTRALVPASQGTVAQEPIVTGPVAPSVFGDDLRKLPTVEPSQHPVIEVPEGAIAPPFSALKGELGPGTYRLEYSFMVGSPSGPVQTVHSAVFTVIDDQ